MSMPDPRPEGSQREDGRVITFAQAVNEALAEEMRQRAAALGASGGAHISTFHSLCVQILRRYAQAVTSACTGAVFRED